MEGINAEKDVLDSPEPALVGCQYVTYLFGQQLVYTAGVDG